MIEGEIMRAQINLDTMSRINEFVSICSRLSCKIDLIDGSGYRVSGKSLVGALATMDWSQVFIESEQDIYDYVQKFLVD